ncbi:MAG TPA: response regulator transcription factor [Methylotenera sp.]|nr:response regulator transcription factor [Methylotenera sp.]HPN02084.1 response regulator transcription factor [Methylotenera sp.]
MIQSKVLLVDDHEVVRSGLRRLLELNKALVVVAEADSGEQAYQVYGDFQPDIVVMDLSMPGMGGLEAAKRILQRHPSARIIIFSMHEAVSFASQALKAGVRGYVTKTGAADDLMMAVNEVLRGKTFLSAGIAQKIALQTLMGDDDPLQQLSSREFEVFRLLAEGRKVEEVADMLKISQKTVANYHTMIKQKLGVTSPIEMVRLAMRHGLIEE